MLQQNSNFIRSELYNTIQYSFHPKYVADTAATELIKYEKYKQ